MRLAEVVDHNVKCGEEGVHIDHESVPFPSGLVSKPTLVRGHLPLKSSPDNSHQAFKVAERFHERLRVPFAVDGEHQMYTSASIGIAIGSQEQPQELVRAADRATYQAKWMGKARSVVFAQDPTTGGAP
jgi:hypothetical protein